MKKIKIAVISCFVLIILLPLVFFNVKNDSISEIDNRKLEEFPFKSFKNLDGTYPRNLLALNFYTEDRIGFRNDMIQAYTIMNDKLFGEMVHPIYAYGKNGYVFNHFYENQDYTDFHKAFCHMVIEIDRYCKERNIPFYFLFEPSKKSIYKEYLPDGVNYNKDWAELLLSNLEKEGVEVIDFTEILEDKKNKDEKVFNVKYDAGHWSSLGAFYSINQLLKQMKLDGLEVYENSFEDFYAETEIKKSLLASNFPINEEVSFLYPKDIDFKNNYKEYEGLLEIDSQNSFFNYFKKNSYGNGLKLLSFQGSYIENQATYMLAKQFSEYISVHNYQNTQNFDYYYNIFKPDAVILDIAEYVFYEGYFSEEKMREMDLNPILDKDKIDGFFNLESKDISLDKNQKLAKVKISRDFLDSKKEIEDLNNFYYWFEIDGQVFDMRKTLDKSNELEVTVDADKIKENSTFNIYYTKKSIKK